MTSELRNTCRETLLGGNGKHSLTFLYGNKNILRAICDVLVIGFWCLYPEGEVFFETGTRFRLGIPHYDHNSKTSELPVKSLFAFSELEKIAGDTELNPTDEKYREHCEEAKSKARELFNESFAFYHKHGGRIVLCANRPPAELPHLEDGIRTLVSGGSVLCVDGEEIGMPLEELNSMGVVPKQEIGRYSELYKSEYLELFPEEPVAELSKEQKDALKQLGLTIDRMTSSYRELFIRQAHKRRQYWQFYNLSQPEKLGADMLAYQVAYVFWNRFNCGEEREEYGFARSGNLGRYLRALKERDEKKG